MVPHSRVTVQSVAHHWKGVYFSLLGRLDEAKVEMHKALEVDPTSLIATADLGQLHYLAREYDQAVDYCNRALALDPSFEIVHYYLYDIYRAKGMELEALINLAAGESAGDPLEQQQRTKELFVKRGLRGELQHRINDYLNTTLSASRMDPVKAVQYYVTLGEAKEAIQELSRALDRPNFLQPYLNVDPIYDPIRNQPEFQSLLRRMNFQ
jgi:tetratricopeptide (TPR) repeat protein